MYDSTPFCPLERLDERTPLLKNIPIAKHMVVGRQGEQMAAKYLRSLGYAIYEQNVRLGHDEIDIVAFDPKDRVIAFVEVKTRSHADKSFSPFLNFTSHKKHCLQRAMRKWVAAHDFEGGYRLDLICIEKGKVTDHIQQVELER